MNRTMLIFFSIITLAFYALLWGTEMMYPKSNASMIVLIGVIVSGIWIVKPGWNLRPKLIGVYSLSLLGLLVLSAAIAAWLLIFFKIPLPYDFNNLKITSALGGIMVLTGIEELLFRQVMYRWLEQRLIPVRIVVLATAVAYGCGHLGPVFIGSPIGPTFFLLQSVFLIWIGLLLGEIRSKTGSWTMSWLGHFGYNVAVLYILSINH